MTQKLEQHELLELCGALCDGTITPQQNEQLQNILSADAAARQLYFEYVDFHIALRRWPWDVDFPASENPAAALQDDDECECEMAHACDRSAPAVFASILPVASIAPEKTGYFSSGWPVAYLIAAVICGIGLTIAAFTYVSQPTDIARHSNDSNPQSLIPNPSSVVARITGTADCRWERKGGVASGEWLVPSEGMQNEKCKLQNANWKLSDSKSLNPQIPKSLVSLGDRFILSDGLMEITYNTGAKVILQGPCTYEVDSQAGGFLSIGKLTARVEKSTKYGVRSTERVVSDGMQNEKCKLQNANYLSATLQIPKSLNPQIPRPSPLFAVRTPTAVVTDLGTEFGVAVTPTGDTETHVFAGKVCIAISSGLASNHRQRQIVRTGQIVRVMNDKISLANAEHSGASPQQFIRALPAPRPSQAADAYAELVLSLRPVAYYRMECPPAQDCNVLLDSTLNAHHGVIHVTTEYGNPWDRGWIGSSLFFHGSSVGNNVDYVIVPRWPTTTQGQFTLAAWVMALSRPARAMIAANWGEWRRGQFHFGLWEDGDLAACVAQRDREHVFAREGATHPFPLAQWQHVAFVFDKSVLRLYRNGSEVASTPSDGWLAEPEVSTLFIGGKSDDDGIAPVGHHRFFWHGRIDELAIFYSALSAGDIRRLSSNPIISTKSHTGESEVNAK